MNSYELSRNWFDFCFENPDKIKPNHTALYFFAIEHCNRLGWKEKYGLPTTMVMEAIGIKSYNTYANTLRDLVNWKFIIMIERSKNQYSANIIALSNFNKAHNKALDKALIKHTSKQSESTIQSTSESIDSIDKQVTSKPLTKKPNNKEPLKGLVFAFDSDSFLHTWNLWLNYRREQKKTIKGLTAAQGQMNKLARLSGGSEQTAQKIVMQSIENNWTGLFELKNNNNERGTNGHYTPQQQANNRAIVENLINKRKNR